MAEEKNLEFLYQDTWNEYGDFFDTINKIHSRMQDDDSKEIFENVMIMCQRKRILRCLNVRRAIGLHMLI